MFLECVFVYVETETLIEVLEENASHIVTLADDDGILLMQLVEVGECGSEHRVSAHISEAR